MFSVVVTYYTTGTHGNAYMVNYTTGEYSSVWFDQTFNQFNGGNAYVGDTAEWVVERPCDTNIPCNIYNLADYGYFYMEGTYNGNLPGTGPASGPDFFTLVCQQWQWNPYNACPNPNYGTVLSSVLVYYPGSGQIVFTPSGATIQYW